MFFHVVDASIWWLQRKLFSQLWIIGWEICDITGYYELVGWFMLKLYTLLLDTQLFITHASDYLLFTIRSNQHFNWKYSVKNSIDNMFLFVRYQYRFFSWFNTRLVSITGAFEKNGKGPEIRWGRKNKVWKEPSYFFCI